MCKKIVKSGAKASSMAKELSNLYKDSGDMELAEKLDSLSKGISEVVKMIKERNNGARTNN